MAPKAVPADPLIDTAIRNDNGIRIVGGSGAAGRLEVSSKDSWVAGDKPVGWRPVCDDAYFDNTMAQVMCKLLGYTYGRQFFSPTVTYRAPDPNATRTGGPVGSMTCFPQRAAGRLLQGVASFDDEADAAQTDEPLILQRKGGAQRGRALAPLRGSVNTPRKAPYGCNFLLGSCDYTGPLAGIECSVPPFTSPPSPVQQSSLIRMVGGQSSTGGAEANLCDGEYDFRCAIYGRAELLVEDWPGSRPGKWLVDARFPDEPFDIPTAPSDDPEDFDASNYTAWVTVKGGDFANALTVQSLQYEVTPSCADGRLFAIYCGVII
ncbi:hypothetical protein GPECTOR_39g467 [Gonium pectorale]|uniref:SRCR domain-containing protein n=1 Tax=Gonium pectorale TaxID=33097 RepID=A0A150GB24_GONPE|nr:hypothetical protein GPECTOR_39g467 [Gonium pectorale]|eukprot:KXZ46973.1 hypothetical protein GPECTOR_39g467 [Gonium pectorale]